MRNRTLPLIILTLLLALVGCRPNSTTGNSILSGSTVGTEQSRSSNNATLSQAVDHEHIAVGNPTNATNEPKNRTNFLIERPQYALSFNNTLAYPNWVSWHLQAKDVGGVDRGDFVPDRNLPTGFKRIVPRDYTGTGYDRGHLCPSKDRSATEEDNDATFLMSNIFPQAPGNNRGPWKDLEEYSRYLLKAGNELYIVAGPAIDRATSKHKTVGKGKVKFIVPEYTWKVILVLPARSGNPLSRITTSTRIIAVWMPNSDTVKGTDWKSFRTTVDEIEHQTGYEFFANLPKDVQATLEATTDTE